MFKSFYKIQHSLIFSDMGLNSHTPNYNKQDFVNLPRTPLSKRQKTNNVLTTNLLVAFVTLFSLRYTNMSKRTAHTSAIVNFNNNLSFVVSFFFLPKRKKNVIFLRAPYKNKLARLNILNLEYTLIFSIRTNPVNNMTPNNLIHIITYFSKFNVSSTKLKHAKTLVSTDCSRVANFNLSSFAN